MLRILVVLVLLLCCWAAPALATEKFAAQTEQDCGHCHLGSLGRW